MTTVKQIHDALFTLAPAYMKESWDNVGLLCGRWEQPVTKVLVALDPFYEVAQETKAVGAQLLVTHHPLSFDFKAVSDGDAVGKTMLYLIESGIAAINLHTNLDSAPGGVNDCLAAALGLTNVKVLAPAGEDAKGRTYGLGRFGEVPQQSLPAFLHHVQSALSCKGLRYADGGKTVSRVAVGGGACADFLKQAAALGCDTFVTGDVKYNGFADARDLGIHMIDAGHYATENVVCPWMRDRLNELFPDLEVLTAKTRTDPVQFL